MKSKIYRFKLFLIALLIAPNWGLTQYRTDAAANEVERCSPNLTIEQTAALVSFAFSLKGTGYCDSQVAKSIKEHGIQSGCILLSEYVIDENGNVSPDLVKRRASERALCEWK